MHTQVEALQLDASDPSSRAQLAATVQQRYAGAIDLLVRCAPLCVFLPLAHVCVHAVTDDLSSAMQGR